jgi:hypothetical protein
MAFEIINGPLVDGVLLATRLNQADVQLPQNRHRDEIKFSLAAFCET